LHRINVLTYLLTNLNAYNQKCIKTQTLVIIIIILLSHNKSNKSDILHTQATLRTYVNWIKRSQHLQQ